ncbi:tetratricopeptide repeat protein [Novosphingobium sp. EMRT-2]|uniref:tetratricopeptide repeat protein n=1 Tax=Novosphingobium sp. EMRT-2 TaxID=2571749 RepID=UPI0010BD1170|nr:tetratricopeptide repeat protein [Novosphingobium sp. EMRT-2]QCI94646.1 tetratricopeptide repeat protein [Novosphingobium sp. EMRT-2]
MALRPTRPQSRSDQLAERKAAQGDVFLREVDDALREDQVFDALRRYGKPVGALVVAGLVGLAGWLWYDYHKATVAGEQGERMTIALDQLEAGRVQTSSDSMAPLVKDGGPGYRAAAQLTQAGIAAQQNKTDDAAKLLAAVAADQSAPQAYRDLATIREVAITMDKLPPEKVVERLKPLAVPGNAWFGSAGELLGFAYLKQGKNDLAGPLFAAMAKDKTVPASIRERARQLAGTLGVDTIDDPKALIAQGQAQQGPADAGAQ